MHNCCFAVTDAGAVAMVELPEETALGVSCVPAPASMVLVWGSFEAAARKDAKTGQVLVKGGRESGKGALSN